ncbi:AAA family ATPase [Caminibacter pacificus]|uniref:Dynein-related subfamily AAA family protein n=1 Tax=Caminibacter pacificus TaxID=1424653 RepID=A0AAJ4RD66_9BACT|nr:AAA family ATPase [Caminibacter pacificus]QCI27605.1 hypothetical protein C6V80_01095 [Caminibacter pacificus]ROR40216.1 dynein-related subfamily AAA family protein [Caminibacter pacificus]
MIWMGKRNYKNLDFTKYENYEKLKEGDEIFIYDDLNKAAFTVIEKYGFNNKKLDKVDKFTEIETDLPYTVLYKTKNGKTFVSLNEKEADFILNIKSKNIDTFENNKQLLNLTSFGNLSFPLKNILFKGVPGTGKSTTIDKIIEEKLELKKGTENYKNNVLKINIHSASSNADLMQGIAITTKNEQVIYKEKQGLVLNHIQNALYNPYEPFVLVLEEIQENSLNELIGDLIYLIEPSKRAKLKDLNADLAQEYSIEDLIKFYENNIADGHSFHSVKIPNLVSDGEFREMIFPDNLYVFCTSNYRDDKKVIEDNLLRRFDVIEIYPNPNVIKDKKVKEFFETMNNAILETFKDEIHPDRFLIGHANWIDVNGFSNEKFYKALLKVIVEFKEIKEIEFETLKKIFDKTINKLNLDNEIFKEENWENYKTIVDYLQNKIYSFLSNNNNEK